MGHCVGFDRHRWLVSGIGCSTIGRHFALARHGRYADAFTYLFCSLLDPGDAGGVLADLPFGMGGKGRMGRFFDRLEHTGGLVYVAVLLVERADSVGSGNWVNYNQIANPNKVCSVSSDQWFI